MTLERTFVLYFDPATFSTRDGVKAAAAEVQRHVRLGRHVAIVTSADPERAGAALAQANRLPPTGDTTEQAEILARPHVEAAERLTVFLRELGLRAEVLEASQVGPITRGSQLDAEPRRFDVPAVAEALSNNDAVVLPGGVGRTEDGRPTFLGGGGGELTAMFVADRLASPLRLVREHNPRMYTSVSHDDAVRSDGRLVGRKAALYARRRQVRYELGAAGGEWATFVGDLPTLRRHPITEHRLTPVGDRYREGSFERAEPEFAVNGG